MKKLIAVLMVLVTFSLLSFNSFASGKLTFKENYNFDTKKFEPLIGLGIYQKIVGGLAYNGWSGTGDPVRSLGDSRWYLTKHAVEFSLWRVTLGIGGQIEYYTGTKEWGKGCFGSISLKLWD